MLSFSILPLLVFGLVCSANPLYKRQSTDTTPFKLYAYGADISGLPIFYMNGTAHAADASKVSAPTMAAMTPVDFTAATDGSNTWTAHSSSTEGVNTLSTDTNNLCLEQGSANSNPVAFTGASSGDRTNQLSNVWSTYGGYVLVDVEGANFYARQTEDGVYSLLWSSSAEVMTDTIPLVLRTVEPATVSVLS
ncbi:uncharacterized protein PGRI_065890 [Penicillium griseofulvum]|uniref:Lipocalin-like domain-containing protein n=1 Tax=Penicillium patulum TaxID=5078 RepID=A0A135LPX4_PENPA|nr:uncharacterized protein PGRI_065890 [Penicillium griseofulvum]KXG51017.1 hypothetical protein PGRI_065890 [Penicillium griseofulvum]